MLVRQISIDKLQEESKKIGPAGQSGANRINKNPKEALCSLFLKGLLNQNAKDWQNYTSSPDSFPFKKNHILELISEA
jgi:hypothetical protein